MNENQGRVVGLLGLAIIASLIVGGFALLNMQGTPAAQNTATPVSAALPTNTPVPPTATATATATLVPPTPTLTGTPVPPTATSSPTATPTATQTTVPPTVTRTRTPAPPTATATITPVPPTPTPTPRFKIRFGVVGYGTGGGKFEHIHLINRDNKPVRIKNWHLISVATGDIFAFPDVVIDPNVDFTVNTHVIGNEDDQIIFTWKMPDAREEWPDGGGTAQLKDDNGVLVAECTYLPNTGPNLGDGACPP